MVVANSAMKMLWVIILVKVNMEEFQILVPRLIKMTLVNNNHSSKQVVADNKF